ncbi:hypothetical protein DID88_010427 [Monilinia fructigena]|uniref:Uncharacterized protein n=1 Tax=Monilinia fructigena TaxID=38457 RepID=A0A395ILQ9_9HELO|nr:hypothetical protein DID88_010427 [Monilinia fructigena]
MLSITDNLSDRCQKLQDISYINLAVSIFILVGILVSYSPQHYRIISRKTSEGISPFFILLGTTSGTCAFTNIIVLPASRADVACCRTVSTLECAAGLLGIAQVGGSMVLLQCNITPFHGILPENTYPSYPRGSYKTTHMAHSCHGSFDLPPSWLCYHHYQCIIGTCSSGCPWSVGKHLGDHSYNPSSHPIPTSNMVNIQSWAYWKLEYTDDVYPDSGSFLWSASLAARLGWGGWSTWGVFLVTGCLQGCLLALGISFVLKSRREKRSSEGGASNGRCIVGYIAGSREHDTDDEGGTTVESTPLLSESGSTRNPPCNTARNSTSN